MRFQNSFHSLTTILHHNMIILQHISLLLSIFFIAYHQHHHFALINLFSPSRLLIKILRKKLHFNIIILQHYCSSSLSSFNIIITLCHSTLSHWSFSRYLLRNILQYFIIILDHGILHHYYLSLFCTIQLLPLYIIIIIITYFALLDVSAPFFVGIFILHHDYRSSSSPFCIIQYFLFLLYLRIRSR